MRPEFRAVNFSVVAGTRTPRAVPTPAPGAEWTYTLPAGYLYRVDFGRATFTAAAEAVNRFLGVEIADPDGQVWWRNHLIAEPFTTGTSAQVSYSPQTNVTGNTGLKVAQLQLPEFLIPAGWTIRSHTFAMTANDTYTAVQLMLSQLFDDYPGHAPGALEGDHLGIDAVSRAGERPQP